MKYIFILTLFSFSNFGINASFLKKAKTASGYAKHIINMLSGVGMGAVGIATLVKSPSIISFLEAKENKLDALQNELGDYEKYATSLESTIASLNQWRLTHYSTQAIQLMARCWYGDKLPTTIEHFDGQKIANGLALVKTKIHKDRTRVLPQEKKLLTRIKEATQSYNKPVGISLCAVGALHIWSGWKGLESEFHKKTT